MMSTKATEFTTNTQNRTNLEKLIFQIDPITYLPEVTGNSMHGDILYIIYT